MWNGTERKRMEEEGKPQTQNKRQTNTRERFIKFSTIFSLRGKVCPRKTLLLFGMNLKCLFSSALDSARGCYCLEMNGWVSYSPGLVCYCLFKCRFSIWWKGKRRRNSTTRRYAMVEDDDGDVDTAGARGGSWTTMLFACRPLDDY